jgi:hypothetical protein
MLLTLFAQKKDADAAGLGGAMACMGTCGIVFLVVFVLIFAIMWKVFTKAGQPGWAALIPIYNNYILVTEICKKEILWFILGFIPIGNIIAAWVICMELARKFGKSDAFGIGIFFLGPVFLAILAFGDAEYEGGRRRRSDYDDEEDEDDRPRRRSRRDEDDDDDDAPPRRRRRRRDDDDDE